MMPHTWFRLPQDSITPGLNHFTCSITDNLNIFTKSWLHPKTDTPSKFLVFLGYFQFGWSMSVNGSTIRNMYEHKTAPNTLHVLMLLTYWSKRREISEIKDVRSDILRDAFHPVSFGFHKEGMVSPLFIRFFIYQVPASLMNDILNRNCLLMFISLLPSIVLIIIFYNCLNMNLFAKLWKGKCLFVNCITNWYFAYIYQWSVTYPRLCC